MTLRQMLWLIPMVLAMLASCERQAEGEYGLTGGQQAALDAAVSATTNLGMQSATEGVWKTAAVYMQKDGPSDNGYDYSHVLYDLVGTAAPNRYSMMAVIPDEAILLPSSGTASFKAYLPAMDDVQDLADPVMRIADWSNQEVVHEHYDLMTASAAGIDMKHPTVMLNFEHAFSKIIFVVKLDENSNLSLDGLKVTASNVLNCPLEYHVLTHELDYAEHVSSDIVLKTEARSDGSVLAYAIVPPEGKDHQVQGRSLTFSLPTSGKTFGWNMSDDIALKAGNSYTWSARVTASEVVIDDIDCPDIESGSELVALTKATELLLDKDYIKVGLNKTKQLVATVLPEDAFDRSVTWTTANEAIATIDQNGMVTGVSLGTTTITATANSNPLVCKTAEVEVVPSLDWTEEPNDSTIEILAPIRR